jgi:HlyD family secretion protein
MQRLRSHWRQIAALIAVLVLLGVALWPEAVEVDLVRVERGPLQVTIDDEGETRVRERFSISAPVAGRLRRIELEPGDPVVRGKTVLAALMPAQPVLLDTRTQSELTAGVESARAAIGQARAERERAAATAERMQSLVRRQRNLAEAGAISRDELEVSETSLRTATEALRAADFSISRAEYDLQIARARMQTPAAGGGRPIEIVSPIDGIVLKRLRESETVVQPGEPLIEVGDPSQLEVVADLLSTDAVAVRPAARVLIEQWGGGHPLEGRVRRVEPSGFTKISALGVEEQRVNVVIDFTAPSAARRLGDAYRVEVRVVLAEDSDALKVPIGALFRRGDSWAAFVVEAGRARTQLVELGHRNAAEAQVLGGLTLGEAVVLHPPDTLTDGVRVTSRAGS